MEFKGINRNVPYSKMPAGFGPDARNGNNSVVEGASVNEGGFKIFQKAGTIDIKKYNLAYRTPGLAQDVVRRQIGEVELDLNRFLIISLVYTLNPVLGTAPVASEIGMFNEDGEYITVVNDYLYTTANKLGFKAEHPVTGEFTKNYLGQLVVALTDGNVSPYLINIDNTIAAGGYTDINTIKMFPDVNEVNTEFTVNDAGGTLDNGAYYFGFDYVNDDLSISSTTLLARPIMIFSERVGSRDTDYQKIAGDNGIELIRTSKSITLTLTNVNTSFDFLSPKIIIKRNGVSQAVRLKDIPITSSTMTVTISSNEGTAITVAEVITPKAKFKTVKKFTQVYNRLYAMRTQVNGLRGLQSTALNAKIQWVTTKVSPFIDGKTVKEQTRTFIHKEVYAFNLHAELLDGTITEGFTIPWNHGDPTNYDLEGLLGPTNLLAASTLANTQGLTMAMYEIEDTIPQPAIVTNKGNTGYWENKDEVYPNLPEFGAFANQPVRHHRMPSINFMANRYSDPNYGITDLDKLDIEVTNVNIPTELKPFIKGWFISYAQRSVDDCTVLGQSITYLQGTSIASYNNGSSASKWYGDAEKSTWSLGSNHSYTGIANGAVPTLVPVTPWYLNKLQVGAVPMDFFCEETLIRMYDLNLLVNKPAISPVYLSTELHYSVKVDYTNAFLAVDNDNHRGDIRIDNINGKLDGTYAPVVRYDVNSIDGCNVMYRKINNYKYLLNNTIDDRHDNRYQEDCLLIELDCSIVDDIPVNRADYNYIQNFSGGAPSPGLGSDDNYAIDTSNWDVWKKILGVWQKQGSRTTYNRSYPLDESTTITELNWLYDTGWGDALHPSYLATIMANPANLYILENQTLVHTNKIARVNETSISIDNAGDGFTTYNSFHAAGWGGTYSNQLLSPSSTEAEKQRCLRSLWIHLTESQVNNQLRGYDGSNTNTQFYPKATTYYTGTDRFNIETNKIYNNDYTSINNIIPLQPYNFRKSLLTTNEYRINRTIAQASESLDFGWRTWLINDYYEVARNKGKLINIEGQDRDIIIQTEKALFKSVGNEQINIDKTTAFIGAGNIFERPAIEFIPSREGTMGSQDMFSCKLTKFGYLSVDREAKSINLLVGNQPISLSDNTLFLWLAEALSYDSRVYYTSSLYYEVPVDNPYIGKGIHVGVDLRYKRLFITKKDFELSAAGKAAVVGGTLVYQNNRWLLGTELTRAEISNSNTTYFNQLGWTVVYEIDRKAFTFFQDYVPNKYYNSRFNTFALVNVESSSPFNSMFSRVFKMNQSNYGIYSNTVNVNVDNPITETATPASFFIMPVFGFDKIPAEIAEVRFQSDVLDRTLPLGNQARWQREPATSILLFNTYQSTQVVTLVPFGNNPASYFTYNVTDVKGNWVFNKIKNWLADNIFNTGVPFITDFSTLDVTKIDVNKPKYNVLPLIDQWVAVKILYNNQIVAGKSKEFRILHVDISAIPTPL